MKNLKEFEINKLTMRDLTSSELNQVVGASICPNHPNPPPCPEGKTGNMLIF
jgi:hypothetical protein